MKLYATTTSERASKGQGGNKEIVIGLNVGSSADSRNIAQFKLLALTNGEYELYYANLDESLSSTLLQRGSLIKGKKKSGEHIHDWDNYGKCCDCGQWDNQ